MTIKVAGIDIGFTRKSPLAFVVLRGDSLIHHELMLPERGAKEWEAAIDSIGRQLSDTLWLDSSDAREVDLIAYELPHVAVNVQTSIKLAHLCGIVRAIGVQCGVPVVGVQPSQAKQALTGNGAASKDEMVRMARLQFGVDLSEHEADACGVALAGLLLAKRVA